MKTAFNRFLDVEYVPYENKTEKEMYFPFVPILFPLQDYVLLSLCYIKLYKLVIFSNHKKTT